MAAAISAFEDATAPAVSEWGALQTGCSEETTQFRSTVVRIPFKNPFRRRRRICKN